MQFVRASVSGFRLGTINLRCPACSHKGAFSAISYEILDAVWDDVDINGDKTYKNWAAGLRVCPNEKCKALVFFADHDGELTTYPPEILDFDSTNLPESILLSLEEAIKAHSAGCYRASALMVRRVLEELCKDKKATGDNLMLRLKSLGNSVIIPGELLEAADELRLLGNDAAHIEAKAYDNIGATECEIAIELTKELLKAVYQYTTLVAKLKALKKP
ncbi:hypothetical protein CQ062_13570 [Ochrobactrum sp. MYb68]|nr:hypothetical protein CQ062_13570 [Ochrobactrum sp. MYb68]